MALMFIGTVRIIHIVFGFVFLDILFLSAGGTSVSAHGGGILAGFIWAKSIQAGVDLSGWAKIFYPSGSSRRGPGILNSLEAWFESKNRKGSNSPSDRRDGSRAPHDKEVESQTDSASDVDTILDKISEKGYDSLTSKEKTTLLDASKDD